MHFHISYAFVKTSTDHILSHFSCIENPESLHSVRAHQWGSLTEDNHTIVYFRSDSFYFAHRSQVDTVTSERDAFRDHASKVSEEKEMLIQESEDTSRQIERLHEGKLK